MVLSWSTGVRNCTDMFYRRKSFSYCLLCSLLHFRAFLSAWLSNIYLSSISVDHDPSCTVSAQHEALARAITARLSARVPQQEPASTPQVPLPIILTHGGFSHGKAAAKFKYPDAVSAAADSTSKKRKRNPLSPCGFSINWQRSVPAAASCFGAGGHTSVLQGDSYASADHKPKEKKLLAVAGGTVEVTIAHSGALQGSVKKSIGGVSAASRLSRYAMRILFEQIVAYCGTHKGENALNSTGMQSTSFVISTKSGDNDGEHVIGGEQVAASSVLLGDKALTSLKDFSYSAMKKKFSSVEYLAAKKAFLEHPVFKDWLCDL